MRFHNTFNIPLFTHSEIKSNKNRTKEFHSTWRIEKLKIIEIKISLKIFANSQIMRKGEKRRQKNLKFKNQKDSTATVFLVDRNSGKRSIQKILLNFSNWIRNPNILGIGTILFTKSWIIRIRRMRTKWQIIFFISGQFRFRDSLHFHCTIAFPLFYFIWFCNHQNLDFFSSKLKIKRAFRCWRSYYALNRLISFHSK